MRLLWLSFIALVSALIVGCNSSNRSYSENTEVPIRSETISLDPVAKIDPSWRNDNTLVFHVLGDPDDLHPTNSGSLMARILHCYIHGYLVVPDKESGNGFVPYLVKDMPVVSADEVEYHYELRDDITWDDGSAITVNDVIFSLKAAKCPLTNNPHFKPYSSGIENVTASEKQTNSFTIRMKEKNLLNIGLLTLFPILQEDRYDELKVLKGFSFTDLNEQPDHFDNENALLSWASKFNNHQNGHDPKLINGLGPYYLSDWNPGQNLTLSLKSGHWSGNITNHGLFEKGNPDRIIFNINRDPNSQQLEFKAQVYDGSSSLNAATFSDLISDSSFLSNYNYTQVRNYNFSYLGLNCRPDGIGHKRIFSDKKVRKAISYAIPYDHINTVMSKRTNQRQVGPVSPLKDCYNDTLALIPFDQKKAIELLENAGWTDSDGDNIRDKEVDGERISLSFELNYMATPTTWKDAALIIAESLYEIGIDCDPVPMTFAVMVEKNRNHDFDAMLAARSGSSYPEDFTQAWHTDSWANQGSNYVAFGNQDSNDLIDSIKVTVDLTERDHLVRRFQEMVYEEMPAIFLFSHTQRIVAHKRFNNVTVYNDKPYLLLNNWALNSVASSESQ